MIQLINGYVQGANNRAVPNGSVSFSLNVDASISAPPYGQVLASIPVVFQFDANGNLVQPAYIWSNAELTPQNENGLGTWYNVTFYDQNGARINQVPLAWQFTEITGAIVDISAMGGIMNVTAPDNYTFTGTNIFAGPVSFTNLVSFSGSVNFTAPTTFESIIVANLESILYADQFPGADMGAKINAAVTYLVASAATYGKIMIPAGNFNVSTTIVLASGCFLEGCGSSTTFLNWVGSSSGVMVDEPAQSNGWGISHLQLQTTSSGGTATAIKMAACNNVLIDDVIINGAGYATGWGTGIYVTGDGSSATSNSVQIRNCRVANYSVAGIQVDHAIDLFVTDCTAYAGSSSDTTAINILCDSGISGAYFKNISTGNGKNGLKVQSSFGGSSATYNGPPWAMFFTDCLFDSLSGGDGILFDSSLGANVVDARFCDCWVASSADHNVHISGGQKINWQGGTIRAASLNGVLIDSANVDYVTIDGAYITSNNTSATSNTNGVTISAAASNVSVVNSFIGNITEPFGGGSQSYGVYVSANAPNFVCVNNNLTANSTGPLYTTSTATQLIAGNLPVTVPNQNNGSSQWFWVIGSGGFQLVDHTSTYVNLGVTDAGVVTARSGLVAPTGTYTGATPTVSSGQVGFGVSTASTASGGSATLPPNPVGFLEVNISGTTYKLPYYAV